MLKLKTTLEMSLVQPSHFTAGQSNAASGDETWPRSHHRFKTVLGLKCFGPYPRGLLPEDFVLGFLSSNTNTQ